MTLRAWPGEAARWYLIRARHPLKNYVVGHYWPWFSAPRFWITYDCGRTISVNLRDYLQQRIFFDGYYEPALVDWLKKTLEPDDVFWDVGANIGAMTLVAAPLCRRVVAFEPDPRSEVLLRRHLAVNRIRNVEVVAAALGTEPGLATLYQASTRNSGMTSLVSGRGQTVGEAQVRVIRADDLIADRPELAPTVMKLDVEGTEHLVLAGARRLLQSGTLRALVFEDQGNRDAGPTNVEMIASLRDARYRIEPFAASDIHASDGMYNFLATPLPASGRG